MKLVLAFVLLACAAGMVVADKIPVVNATRQGPLSAVQGGVVVSPVVSQQQRDRDSFSNVILQDDLVQQAPRQRTVKLRIGDEFNDPELTLDLDKEKANKRRPLEEQLPLPKYSRAAFLHLVYEFPKVSKPGRQVEFTKALQYNVDHPLIKTIHLFVQADAKAFVLANIKDEGKKIEFLDTEKQVLYSELFDWANKHLAGKICIVMNADIEIGDGWDKVTENSYRSGNQPVAFALSRYQRSDCGKLSTFCFGDGGGRDKGDFEPFRMSTGGTSHDSFSFLAPVPDGVSRQTKFKQNEWTAENHVISALRNAGVQVINPCLTLQTWHEHCSEFRTYSQVSRLPRITNGNERPSKLPGA